MAPLSEQQQERSRKNFSTILAALGRAGQVHVAAAIGVHESTVSKIKSDELERLAALLAACGLKVVPQEFRCAKPEIIEAALVFARAAMEQHSSSLVWDD